MICLIWNLLAVSRGEELPSMRMMTTLTTLTTMMMMMMMTTETMTCFAVLHGMMLV